MTRYEAINATIMTIDSLPDFMKNSKDFMLCVSKEVAQHLFDELYELVSMPKKEVVSGEAFLYMGYKIKVA